MFAGNHKIKGDQALVILGMTTLPLSGNPAAAQDLPDNPELKSEGLSIKLHTNLDELPVHRQIPLRLQQLGIYPDKKDLTPVSEILSADKKFKNYIPDTTDIIGQLMTEDLLYEDAGLVDLLISQILTQAELELQIFPETRDIEPRLRAVQDHLLERNIYFGLETKEVIMANAQGERRQGFRLIPRIEHLYPAEDQFIELLKTFDCPKIAELIEKQKQGLYLAVNQINPNRPHPQASHRFVYNLHRDGEMKTYTGLRMPELERMLETLPREFKAIGPADQIIHLHTVDQIISAVLASQIDAVSRSNPELVSDPNNQFLVTRDLIKLQFACAELAPAILRQALQRDFPRYWEGSFPGPRAEAYMQAYAEIFDKDIRVLQANQNGEREQFLAEINQLINKLQFVLEHKGFEQKIFEKEATRYCLECIDAWSKAKPVIVKHLNKKSIFSIE